MDDPTAASQAATVPASAPAAGTQVAAPGTTVAEAPVTIATKADKPTGPDPLASLENDNSAFVLGVVPVIVMGVLFLAFLLLYLHRRRKNWNDLDEALRIDGGDTPVGTGNSH